MNNQFNLPKAIIAGVLGTIAMTLFMYMGNFMGLQMNVPKMLGSMFGGSILIGWIMHFMIGSTLAVGYGLILNNQIRIDKLWLRGAIFGLVPWLMAQILVMPMMSMMNGMTFTSGLFSGSFVMSFASLMAHLVFGAVVGLSYTPSVNLDPIKA